MGKDFLGLVSRIFKAVHPFDWLIAVAAVIILAEMDFAALTTINIIYLVTFVIWFVLFVLRIVLTLRRSE